MIFEVILIKYKNQELRLKLSFIDQGLKTWTRQAEWCVCQFRGRELNTNNVSEQKPS